MNKEIKGMLTRLESSKTIDELKAKFSTLCRILVESFNLEKCLILFFEANPIVDRFAVSFPVSKYEHIDDAHIGEIEAELVLEGKLLTVYPIMHNANKIGALVLLPKNESTCGNSETETLNTIADKCAEAIGKQVECEGRGLLVETIAELMVYEKDAGPESDVDHETLFYLSMGIIVPTQVYIAYQTEDGPYIYVHLFAADGLIEDKKIGTFMEDLYQVKINNVLKNTPGITEIDIISKGKVKGKLMVTYDCDDCVYSEEIKKFLVALAPNLTSLMVLIHQGCNSNEFLKYSEMRDKAIFKNIGKRLRKAREQGGVTVRETCVLLNTTEKLYLAIENGDVRIPFDIYYKLSILGISLDWLICGDEAEPESHNWAVPNVIANSQIPGTL